MRAADIRVLAARGGHQLTKFQNPAGGGIGPVATCDCGLGVTQQRRGPGRGATLIWRHGTSGHIASDMHGEAVVRVLLAAECPFKAYRGLPISFSPSD